MKNQINVKDYCGYLFLIEKFNLFKKKHNARKRYNEKFDLKTALAFKHIGFWQCMDTLSDKELLKKGKKNLMLNLKLL